MGSKHIPPRWWEQGRYEDEVLLHEIARIMRVPLTDREKITRDAFVFGTGFGRWRPDGTLEHIPAPEMVIEKYVAGEPEYLGERYELNNTKFTIEKSEKEPIGWTTWIEENGAPVLRVDTHAEIPVDVDLAIGEEILAPTLFGYARVKVSTPASAENEGYYACLHRGPGVWRSSGGGNKEAIRKIAVTVKI